MSNLLKNLSYLAWSKGIPRKDWKAHIADWLGVEISRLENILLGQEISQKEIDYFQHQSNLNEDELMTLLSGDLLAENGVNIWRANIAFLVEQLSHGQQVEKAKELGVSPSTLSRWRSRTHQPPVNRKAAICKSFSISSQIDLEKDPLFLAIEPVSSLERREWLKARIDQMSELTLNELFPALTRLLRDP